jgi:hypothetical protein
MVIDDGVDKRMSEEFVADPSSPSIGHRPSVTPSLSPANKSPATAIGDIAQFLDVHVDKRPGMIVLVAADGLAGTDVDV